MKGKIEITCDEQGVHLSVNVHQCKDHDRAFVVHALGKALGLEYVDYMVLAAAEHEGILQEAGSPVMVTIDTEGLKKQLEEQYES